MEVKKDPQWLYVETVSNASVNIVEAILMLCKQANRDSIRFPRTLILFTTSHRIHSTIMANGLVVKKDSFELLFNGAFVMYSYSMPLDVLCALYEEVKFYIEKL